MGLGVSGTASDGGVKAGDGPGPAFADTACGSGVFARSTAVAGERDDILTGAAARSIRALRQRTGECASGVSSPWSELTGERDGVLSGAASITFAAVCDVPESFCGLPPSLRAGLTGVVICFSANSRSASCMSSA